MTVLAIEGVAEQLRNEPRAIYDFFPMILPQPAAVQLLGAVDIHAWAAEMRAVAEPYVRDRDPAAQGLTGDAVRSLLRLTGWSIRRVASDMIGVSHSTLNRILRNQATPRWHHEQGIINALRVAERLSIAVGGNKASLRRILLDRHNEYSKPAVEALRAGHPAEAIAIALASLHPHPAGMLEVPSAPFPPGDETVGYADEG